MASFSTPSSTRTAAGAASSTVRTSSSTVGEQDRAPRCRPTPRGRSPKARRATPCTCRCSNRTRRPGSPTGRWAAPVSNRRRCPPGGLPSRLTGSPTVLRFAWPDATLLVEHRAWDGRGRRLHAFGKLSGGPGR
jgi:hypothetical protein